MTEMADWCGEYQQATDLICQEADLTALIRELADESACQYDHHGKCQTHGLAERPCPHQRARLLLERIPGNRD